MVGSAVVGLVVGNVVVGGVVGCLHDGIINNKTVIASAIEIATCCNNNQCALTAAVVGLRVGCSQTM